MEQQYRVWRRQNYLLLIPQHSFKKDNEMFTILNSQFKTKIAAKSYSSMLPGREKPALVNNTIYFLQTRSAHAAFRGLELQAECSGLHWPLALATGPT